MNKKLMTISPSIFKYEETYLVNISLFISLIIYFALIVVTCFLFNNLDDNINSQVENRTINMAIDPGKEDLLSEWGENNDDIVFLKPTGRLLGNQHIHDLVIKDYQRRQHVIKSVPNEIGQFSIAHHIMDIQYDKITFQKTIMKFSSGGLLIIFSIIYVISFYEYTLNQQKNVKHLRYLGFKSSIIFLMLLISNIKHMSYKMILSILLYPLVLHRIVIWLIELTSLNRFISSYAIGLKNTIIIVVFFITSITVMSCLSLKLVLKNDNNV